MTYFEYNLEGSPESQSARDLYAMAELDCHMVGVALNNKFFTVMVADTDLAKVKALKLPTKARELKKLAHDSFNDAMAGKSSKIITMLAACNALATEPMDAKSIETAKFGIFDLTATMLAEAEAMMAFSKAGAVH